MLYTPATTLFAKARMVVGPLSCFLHPPAHILHKPAGFLHPHTFFLSTHFNAHTYAFCARPHTFWACTHVFSLARPVLRLSAHFCARTHTFSACTHDFAHAFTALQNAFCTPRTLIAPTHMLFVHAFQCLPAWFLCLPECCLCLPPCFLHPHTHFSRCLNAFCICTHFFVPVFCVYAFWPTCMLFAQVHTRFAPALTLFAHAF